MAIIDFFVEPDTVGPGDILTLNAFFDSDDCPTVVYELPEGSPFTFGDDPAEQLRRIESTVEGEQDITTTTLCGADGTATVFAYCIDDPDNKLEWLVEYRT